MDTQTKDQILNNLLIDIKSGNYEHPLNDGTANEQNYRTFHEIGNDPDIVYPNSGKDNFNDFKLSILLVIILSFNLALDISGIILGKRETVCINVKRFSDLLFITGIIGTIIVGLYIVFRIIFKLTCSKSIYRKSDKSVLFYKTVNMVFFITIPVFLCNILLIGTIEISSFFRMCTTQDYHFAMGALIFIICRYANLLFFLLCLCYILATKH